MIRYVVDASVGIKWLLREPDSIKALSLISERVERVVPDLFHSEIGNALWKNVRTGKLSASEARSALQHLHAIRLTVIPVSTLMETTLDIARSYDRSFYDSSYIALAVQEKATLVTADLRLLNAMNNTPFSQIVAGLHDLTLTTRRRRQ